MRPPGTRIEATAFAAKVMARYLL